MFKIKSNFRNFYWCDHLRTYKLDEFQNDFGKNEIIYLGQPKVNLLDKFTSKKKIYIDFEEPNRISHLKMNTKIIDLWKGGDYDHQFDKIFSICPYTSEWLNLLNKNFKRTSIFHPTNEKLIFTEDHPKDIDIIYTGNIHGMKEKIIENMLMPITKFNYRVISSFGSSPIVTDKNISNNKKFELLARSKISIMQFLLFPNDIAIRKYQSINKISKNKAFDKISEGIIPQMKSRPFEAAFSKTLMLVKKDPFNLIEKYFEPNKHFVYFDDNNLNKIIVDILKNFDEYQILINNAYEHATKNYTRKKFLTKILTD